MNKNILEAIDWLPDFQIRQSIKAKRISLSITAKKGLEIILPARYSERVVINFLHEKKSWILSHEEILNQAKKAAICPANVFLAALNEDWDIVCQPGYTSQSVRIKENGQYLLLQGATHNIKACHQALRRWLLKKAKYYFPVWLNKISATTGLNYKELRIRGQSSIWGSCSAGGDISFKLQVIISRFFFTSLCVYFMSYVIPCITITQKNSGS